MFLNKPGFPVYSESGLAETKGYVTLDEWVSVGVVSKWSSICFGARGELAFIPVLGVASHWICRHTLTGTRFKRNIEPSETRSRARTGQVAWLTITGAIHALLCLFQAKDKLPRVLRMCSGHSKGREGVRMAMDGLYEWI